MTKNELDNVVKLIDERKYEKALEKMVDVKPLKDCKQNNPHHKYNVYDHIIKSVSYVEYAYRTVVSNINIEDVKQWFIDNEEGLLTLLKLVMLLHDTGKPNCKKINQKTGFDSFIKHEKVSEEIANEILTDDIYPSCNEILADAIILYADFETKTTALWLIKNHEYINKDTCTNKKSIRKKYNETSKNDKIMFMLSMIRLADISAQSEFGYQEKYEQNIEYIKTLEEVISD